MAMPRYCCLGITLGTSLVISLLRCERASERTDLFAHTAIAHLAGDADSARGRLFD